MIKALLLLVLCIIRNAGVVGSNPIGGTINMLSGPLILNHTQDFSCLCGITVTRAITPNQVHCCFGFGPRFSGASLSPVLASISRITATGASSPK